MKRDFLIQHLQRNVSGYNFPIYGTINTTHTMNGVEICKCYYTLDDIGYTINMS